VLLQKQQDSITKAGVGKAIRNVMLIAWHWVARIKLLTRWQCSCPSSLLMLHLADVKYMKLHRC
jgi:hypothetical protein